MAIVLPRVRRSRAERVAEIILAAREVFVERGYEKAAVAEIASRVGVVEAAVYRFFESKRDLLICVICHWYEEVMRTYDSGLLERKSLRDRLRFLIWHHLQTMHDNPVLANLFFNLVRTTPEYLESELYRLNKKYMGRVSGVLEEGIVSGEVRPDISIRIIRDMIYGAAEQRTWGFRIGLTDFDPDVVADEITDVVIHACCRVPHAAGNVSDVDAKTLLRMAEGMRAIAGRIAQGGDRD